MAGGATPGRAVELETGRLLLRPWRVAEAAVQRELWTERDPRVPPHRRIDADGHPSVADLEESIRTNQRPASPNGSWAATLIRIEGGTQAPRRTINARLEIEMGTIITISVPRPFGAVILKAAAYRTDGRDRDRHLADAAALLACIETRSSNEKASQGLTGAGWQHWSAHWSTTTSPGSAYPKAGVAMSGRPCVCSAFPNSACVLTSA
jgi:hypothetical protein